MGIWFVTPGGAFGERPVGLEGDGLAGLGSMGMVVLLD